MWNLCVDPLMAYFIFSSLRNNIRSFIQTEALGGCSDFHSNKILLRARGVANANTSFSLFDICIPPPGHQKLPFLHSAGYLCRMPQTVSDKP